MITWSVPLSTQPAQLLSPISAVAGEFSAISLEQRTDGSTSPMTCERQDGDMYVTNEVCMNSFCCAHLVNPLQNEGGNLAFFGTLPLSVRPVASGNDLHSANSVDGLAVAQTQVCSVPLSLQSFPYSQALLNRHSMNVEKTMLRSTL